MGLFLDLSADPKEIYNWRLWFLVATAANTGAIYGFDSGNIGGIIVLPSFVDRFGLNAGNANQKANLSANIVTALQMGAVAGAISVGPLADWIGRRLSLLGFGVVFFISCILSIVTNGNLGLLYAGRVLSGVATGALVVLGPMYIAENAPRRLRGALAVGVSFGLLIGQVLAFWINYAVSLYPASDRQWRVAIAMQILPGGLLIIGMLFQKESPRFLAKAGRFEDGIRVLSWIRQLPATHPYVVEEYQEIRDQLEAEDRAIGNANYFQQLKRLVGVASNRRRFILSLSMQALAQATGINAINYYSPTIFQSLGIKGTSQSLLATGVYGIIKTVATLFYVTLIVDRFGRRRPLLAGAIIQFSSLLYIAIYLGVDPPSSTSTEVSAAGKVGLAALYIYSVGWAIGWSPMPYLFTAEAFPNSVRSVGVSWTITWNWLCSFAISRATPFMILAMKAWGTFAFFAIWAFGGIVFAFFLVPELSGHSLESIDEIFSRPLSTILKNHTHIKKPIKIPAADEETNTGSTSTGSVTEPKFITVVPKAEG